MLDHLARVTNTIIEKGKGKVRRTAYVAMFILTEYSDVDYSLDRGRGQTEAAQHGH